AEQDLVGEEGVEVVHGIDLGRRGIGPAEAERGEPALHLAEHVARLLAHGVGRGFTVPHGAFAVSCAALPRLAAARDHEARRGVAGGDGEGERVERGLSRRVDLGAHVAARDRIHLSVEQAPLLQRDHVDFVEGAKALLGEGGGRAQFAGAEGRQRAAGCTDDALDACEAFRERHRRTEAHALDRVAALRRSAAGILEHAGQETIAARGEIDCVRHLFAHCTPNLNSACFTYSGKITTGLPPCNWNTGGSRELICPVGPNLMRPKNVSVSMAASASRTLAGSRVPAVSTASWNISPAAAAEACA